MLRDLRLQLQDQRGLEVAGQGLAAFVIDTQDLAGMFAAGAADEAFFDAGRPRRVDTHQAAIGAGVGQQPAQFFAGGIRANHSCAGYVRLQVGEAY